ncbi:MAG TPA: hypothetical protein VHB79_27560 [Polyangiaceae bacterium]|nr:hypothetical protein [Polyangiaceae bacterium]
MATGLRLGRLLVLLPLLAACGGKSSTIVRESSGGSSSGGSGAVAGTSANAGSGGVVNECTRYDDESPIGVNVTLINKTSQPLYLGQQMTTCGVAPLFSVEAAGGKPLPSVGDCRVSCAGARGGIGGCPAICLFPNSVKLEPGEGHYTTWDSLYAVQASLPPRCLSYEGAQGEQPCTQAKRVAAGDYTFRAVAALEVDCSMTSGNAMCGACTPDANGGCTISGGIIGGQNYAAEATATLDVSYGYSDPAASSSPGAGDAAGALPTPEIELIFTE